MGDMITPLEQVINPTENAPPIEPPKEAPPPNDGTAKKLEDENQKLREEIEALKMEKMTADERKKHELDEKTETLNRKEKELRAQELKIHAIKAIKEAGLDDGSDKALELVDCIMGADEETISKRATTFKAMVDARVAAQVDKRFKDSGRDIAGAGSAGGKDGPDTSIATQLGKAAAERGKKSQDILGHYLGGKR